MSMFYGDNHCYFNISITLQIKEMPEFAPYFESLETIEPSQGANSSQEVSKTDQEEERKEEDKKKVKSKDVYMGIFQKLTHRQKRRIGTQFENFVISCRFGEDNCKER